jgi:hypothetical protein
LVSMRTEITCGPVTAAALALASALMMLPACSGSDGSSSSTSPAASQSADPSASVETVGFDQAYRIDESIVVQITEIEVRKLGMFPKTEDPDAKEGDPYVWLMTKTTNKTAAKVELVPGAVLKYGPDNTMAAQVAVVDEMDGVYELGANEVREYPFGFIIPDDAYSQVLMEVTTTIDPLRTAIFSGSIKPS